MREGSYKGGSNQARRRQQVCSSGQSLVLRSGRQGRGRGRRILVGCLVLWFVAWVVWRFWTAALISSGNLHHSAPVQSFGLELYWYYGHSVARNETLAGLAGPVHCRRRGRQQRSRATKLTRQKILDEEEEDEEEPSDGKGGGGDLSLEFDPLKKRTGCNTDCDSMASSPPSTQLALLSGEGASSSATAGGALKPWPLLGGHRRHDQAIEPLYARVVLGSPGAGKRRPYILQVDSGSAQTWVNCVGSPVAGPSGLFNPSADSYLNCETSKETCDNFQDGRNSEQPCDCEHDFRCLYTYSYGDGTVSSGSVINADINFDLSDGAMERCRVRHTIAIGCSTEGKVADIFSDGRVTGVDTDPPPLDGILGIGRHPAGLLSQLYSLNLFSEYVTAICLEHARPRGAIGPRGLCPPMEYAGFLSFGDLYTLQAATTVWTDSIVLSADRPQDAEALYTAQLVGVMYRDSSIFFRSKKRKRGDDGGDSAQIAGTHFGFDTGRDLTYLSPTLFKEIEKLLARDARRMGYKACQDAPEHVRHGVSRKCWSDPKDLSKSLVQDFGELTIKFSSLANDDTTSDLVIKPENYITVDNGAGLRTCFNMRKEDEYPFGSLGAEAMKGHLIIFNDRPHQIGWSPVTSCRDLR